MMGVPADGVVILDANCIRCFETEQARAGLDGNLRAVGLEVWPTAMNVYEAVKHENPRMRVRLLETIGALANGRPVLAWPHQVLRGMGRAIAEGKRTVSVCEHELDWVLERPGDLSDEEVQGVKAFLENRELEFNATHERGRKEIQPVLKRLGGMSWPSVRDFLNQQWMIPDHIDDYIKAVWAALGLRGDPPISDIKECDAWMLFLEGWGAAVYERAVVKEQRQRVQEADLLQLVYLGGTKKRFLATKDKRFREVAEEILTGRYKGARVVHPEVWLN